MSKSCKKGSIMRKSYVRHINNNTIRVKKGCIKSQSQSGKKRSLIDLETIKKLSKTHAKIRSLFGTPKCRKGQVMREGYTRKAFTKKSGIHIKSSRVGPGCIKATGLSKKRGTKGKQLFVLEKGTLTKYGYHANLSEEERHSALKKALIVIKPLSLYRKLNALYILNKNKDITIASIYRADAEWIQTTPEYIKRS